jgi:hypothetical protein
VTPVSASAQIWNYTTSRGSGRKASGATCTKQTQQTDRHAHITNKGASSRRRASGAGLALVLGLALHGRIPHVHIVLVAAIRGIRIGASGLRSASLALALASICLCLTAVITAIILRLGLRVGIPIVLLLVLAACSYITTAAAGAAAAAIFILLR